MKEYELIFSKMVHQKLQEKIVGKIFVEVNKNDELYVQIIRDHDTVFRTRIDSSY